MTHDEFMVRMARDCRNCLECSSRPCDACCAGGICDRECHCDAIADEDYDGMTDRGDDERDAGAAARKGTER